MAEKLKGIKSLYKNNATRPFMYAGTILLGGLVFSGGCYIAGWLVSQISFSITALRGIHLSSSLTYLIKNPLFWKVIGIIACIAFVVGTTISIFSALGKNIKKSMKNKSKSKEKSNEKQQEQEVNIGHKKEQSNDISNSFKINKHHSDIHNNQAQTSKNNYYIKSQKDNINYQEYQNKNINNDDNVYDKKIRDFNKNTTFGKNCQKNNNNEMKYNNIVFDGINDYKMKKI